MIIHGMPFRVHADGRRRADAPTVVLIHGIGTSHRYLARLHEELARTYDVIWIDLPGFGGVPKPSFAPSVQDMARALGTILERLGRREVVLVGHSMGTQWAVETAVLHPGLVRGVVAIGPVTDDRRRTLAAQAVALARDIAGEPPTANAVVLVDYLRCGPSWFLREVRHMLSYPIEERVALLEVPLLVMRGGNDPVARLDWCRRLRDRARSGRLAIVPGHRHNAQFTAPRAVASAITAFERALP